MRRFLAGVVGAVLVFVCVGRTAADIVVLDTQINSANGHTYHLLSQSNWTDAEAKAIELGGHLATIRNEEENNWIFNTFSHYGGVSRYLWIGLSDDVTAWHWSSGEPVTYTNWDIGQPSHGYSGEPYTLMYPDPPYSPRWDDWQNSQTFADGLPMLAVSENVPEPSNFVLLGAGAVSLLAYAWRRRKLAK